MDSSEDHYKREEDRKWRESVEARLVSLTSAQKTTDDDLDKHEGRIDDMEQLLEGDPLKREDSGLKGDVADLNRAVNSLRAIMAPDALGHGGLKHRLESVEEALGLRVQTSKYRWLVLLGIISATSAVTVAVVENMDRIATAYSHLTNSKPTKKKNSGKNAGKRHPKPTPEDDGSDADVP